jgi:hypothetical protein
MLIAHIQEKIELLCNREDIIWLNEPVLHDEPLAEAAWLMRKQGYQAPIPVYDDLSQKAGGRVVANGCLIRRKGARREHLDYIYRGLMSQHAKLHCDMILLVFNGQS